jgi:surface protein
MVDMFYGCSNLKSLDLSNFNTSKVTLSDFMFYNCTSIKYINLYNAYINDDIKSQIEKIVKNTTIVCQKEKIINNGIKNCYIFNLPDNEFSCFESNNLSNTTTQIISTIKEISTTFPEIKNEETNVVLLGFSQFRQFKENFTFYIYFTATKYILYTKHILFPMEITYNRNIRRLLKEAKANCTLDQVESDIKYKYYCQVDKEPDNIKEVKLIPDFNFVSQDNVTLTGITPLAKMFINNMTTLTQDNIYGNILENSFIYIMDNSNFYKYDKFLFNITGEINDPQPKLDNKNLLLMINLENNDTTDIQIQCNISKITGNNYILHCKSNESFKGEMQSAVSFIDNDDILLLNFVDIKESNINIEATRNNRKFFIKKASKLGAGAIVGIIIPIIVVIAFVIFHFKKKNKKDVNDSNSSIKEFKIPDGIKH